jgi:hypothetical protein
MEQDGQEVKNNQESRGPEIRTVIQETIHEYLDSERAKVEPAYKTELVEERRRREQLEKRVNELISENQRSRTEAEQMERSSAIRDELRRLGVAKVDLGFRAVRDDIVRSEDGRLVAKSEEGEIGLSEYLARFTQENPELLPARIAGGSGASGGTVNPAKDSRPLLDRIRPGMDREQLDEVRQEIAQALAHSIHKGG